MTPTRLVIAHADDHEVGTGVEGEATLPVATATSETVPLTAVRGVMLTHVVGSPDTYVPGPARARDHPDHRLGCRRPDRHRPRHLRRP